VKEASFLPALYVKFDGVGQRALQFELKLAICVPTVVAEVAEYESIVAPPEMTFNPISLG
jgi:hypothetical protein